MRHGAAVEPELVGPRALREWITGEQKEHSRVFFVESGASQDRVDGVAGPHDVVLLPEGSAAYEGEARTVRYSGGFREIGDELFFGTRGIELQDYIAASFVQIVGPTAVCLFDAAGRQAFLDDMELARRTGVFPSALLDPRVILADRSALERPEELESPHAVRVSADGGVSIGVRGEVIGRVDDLPTLLSHPLPRAAVWRGRASENPVTADITRRDRIERYLGATDLMKMLRVANGAAKISGFGWSLLGDDLGDAEPAAADPFLLETAEGLVLADTRTLRRQLLSPPTAMVVAVVQTSSTPEAAAERVARRLGMGSSDADILCREAVTALNARRGARVDASGPTEGNER